MLALWLGHEQVSTANISIHADMSHKERTVARIQPPGTKTRPLPPRRQPPRLPRDPLINADTSQPLTTTEQLKGA